MEQENANSKIKLYTPAEAARLTGYNEVYLVRLCLQKRVAHTRRGRRYFFTAEEMAKLIVHVEPQKANVNAKGE